MLPLEVGEKIYIDKIGKVLRLCLVQPIDGCDEIKGYIYCMSEEDEVYKFSIAKDGRLERI